MIMENFAFTFFRKRRGLSLTPVDLLFRINACLLIAPSVMEMMLQPCLASSRAMLRAELMLCQSRERFLLESVMYAGSWCHPKPIQHPAPLSASACEPNKVAVTHLLMVLGLTHTSVRDGTSPEVFTPSVFAT